MSDKAKHLTIWNAVEKTDPAYTKSFNRGFKGTAINATWLAKRATEVFGPIGHGWGVKVLDEKYQRGAGEDIVHIIRIELWYIADGKRCSVEHYGQTIFVGKNKNGLFTDEEAPKKSLTDAMSKALSLLGFGSDVHLGMYEDSKYVAAVDREYAEKDKQEKLAEKAAKQQDKPADNVVQLKGKVPAEAAADADGVIDPGQLALAELKADLDAMTTSNAVMLYMTKGGDGLKKLEKQSKEILDEGRAYAGEVFKRLKAQEVQSVPAAE